MSSVTPQQTARTLVRRFEEKQRRHAEAMQQARAAICREVPPIAARHAARRVYLFGSLAWGGTHEGSDIDLALEGVQASERSAVAAELAMVLPLAVDVLSLEELPEAFRARIVERGVPVYEANG